jgi:hypothetical protein
VTATRKVVVKRGIKTSVSTEEPGAGKVKLLSSHSGSEVWRLFEMLVWRASVDTMAVVTIFVGVAVDVTLILS